MAAGKDDGLLPAGLGARDTLRLEAKMCLYGNDMDETTTLVEAGLGWIVSADEAKGDFIGRAVLARAEEDGRAAQARGLRDDRPGDRAPRLSGPPGRTRTWAPSCSGSYAPFLQKNIGLVYLPAAQAAVGTELTVDIRGRAVEARVVPTPFYKRPR